ncbi:MAG: hypothetical protein H0V18_08220 [Pyrinomonadaceae bacterium]|nr:hypothetical protein [Pyrinomonadaceae bacterium]
MQPITMFLASLLVVVATFSSAWSQTGVKVEPQGSDSSQPKPTSDADETNGARTTAAESPEKPAVWIHLVGGGQMQVDEVIERSEGIWYKRGNISTFLERARVVRIERVSATKPISVTDPLRGSGTWRISDSAKVESFFLGRFGRSLPLGAFGQSDLHTRWGLDHRNGMDVSLHPDSPEGRTLISFLRTEGIPFLAFRGPIPGVATGPHIHVGNPSPRFSGRK